MNTQNTRRPDSLRLSLILSSGIAAGFAVTAPSSAYANPFGLTCNQAALLCGVETGATLIVGCLAAASEAFANPLADAACAAAAFGEGFQCVDSLDDCGDEPDVPDVYTGRVGNVPKKRRRQRHYSTADEHATASGLQGWWDSDGMNAMQLYNSNQVVSQIAGRTSGSSNNNTSVCQGNDLLRGIRVYYNNEVRGMRAICGDYSNVSYRRFRNTIGYSRDANTNAALTWTDLECADGYYVKEVETLTHSRRPDSMRAIRVRCGGPLR